VLVGDPATWAYLRRALPVGSCAEVDRTEASIAPTRGAARTEDRAVPPKLRTIAAVVVGSLWATASVLVSVAPPAGAAGGAGQSSSALSLLAPPAPVTPSQPFVAKLLPASSLDRSSLTLRVSLYPLLQNRSAFDETLGGSPSGSAISSSGSNPVSVASLPADPSNPRGFDLTIPVDAQGHTTPGSGPFTADLPCSPGCYGVYPLRIEMFQGSSTSVGQLLTYLVYTTGTSTQPLRFAVVLPVATSEHTPSTTGALPTPSASDLAGLDTEASVLSEAQTRVPITLAPSPATMRSLSADTAARSQQTLHSLAAIATSAGASGRQVLCGPFANVDASQLVSAGLQSELSSQIREGASALDDTLHTSCASGGIWFSGATLDQSALSALSGLGYSEVVVPQSAVSGTAPSTAWTQPLALGDTKSESLLAKTVDPLLSDHLQPSSHTDPVLSADQVLAELETIYFDYPADIRGVVAVAPSGWGTNPTLVTDVLSGLQNNPLVRAVTMNDLFSQVPVGGTTGSAPFQPSSRKPAADGSTTGLPAGAIRSARSRLEGFAAAVSQTSQGAQESALLGQLLLLGESSALSSRQQLAAVTAASGALSAQLRLLSISAGDIRLTSNAAPVPITLVKSLPYPVTGVLGVTSDKLAFPQGSQSPGSFCHPPTVTSSAGRSTYSSLCVIGHSTNVVYVNMRSRASGDFRVSVTLTSPTGSLVLAGGQVTVRSMSTSFVAILLSVLAALVLLAWWAGTLIRRRGTRGARGARGAKGRRRPAHGRGIAARAAGPEQ